MTTYQIAAGWDNTGGLADFSYLTRKPPRMAGITYGETRVAGDHLEYEDGYRVAELVYGWLTKTEIAALLSQFGLSDSTISAKVTIKLPANASRTFTNYNAVIHAPKYPDDGEHYFGVWRDVTFPLSQIHGAS